MADASHADIRTTIINPEDFEAGVDSSTVIVRENALSKLTPENIQRLDDIRNLSWFDRTFRKIDSGSLRGVIIMWVRMTLGIGILTLPYYVKVFGALTGFVLIIAAAVLNILTYNFIFEASFHTDKKNYGDLIEELMGVRMHKIFKWTFLLDIVSTMMTYCIVSYTLFKFILYYVVLGSETMDPWMSKPSSFEFNEFHPSMLRIRAAFFAVIFLVNVPLFLKKNLDSLQKVTVGYLFALFFLVFIILCEVPFFVNARKNENIGFALYKPVDWTWIEAFFGICLSFYVQPFIFSLRGELLLPSLKRTKKIARFSVSLEAIIFVVLGISGYYALGDKYTTEMLITRTPYLNKEPISEYLFRFTICIFFVLNTIGLAMYNPSLREYIYPYIKVRYEGFKYAILSLVPFALICVVAFAYPYVTELIGFFSVTVYNFNGYIIPMLMKIKIMERKKEPLYKKAVLYFFIALFTIVGAVGFAYSIITKVQKAMEDKSKA